MQGQSDNVGSVPRVPAPLIEKLVINAIRKRLNQTDLSASIIRDQIARVEGGLNTLKVDLGQRGSIKGQEQITIRDHYPVVQTALQSRKKIIPPAKSSRRIDQRPIRSETRTKLVQAIAQDRR